eukprot:5514491-Amphidinium_carterae.1
MSACQPLSACKRANSKSVKDKFVMGAGLTLPWGSDYVLSLVLLLHLSSHLQTADDTSCNTNSQRTRMVQFVGHCCIGVHFQHKL